MQYCFIKYVFRFLAIPLTLYFLTFSVTANTTSIAEQQKPNAVDNAEEQPNNNDKTSSSNFSTPNDSSSLTDNTPKRPDEPIGGTLVLIVEQQQDLISLVQGNRLDAEFPFTPYNDESVSHQRALGETSTFKSASTSDEQPVEESTPDTNVSPSPTDSNDTTSNAESTIPVDAESALPSAHIKGALTIEWFNAQAQLIETQRVKPVDRSSLGIEEKVRFSLRLPWVTGAHFISVYDERFSSVNNDRDGSKVSLKDILVNQVSILDQINQPVLPTAETAVNDTISTPAAEQIDTEQNDDQPKR